MIFLQLFWTFFKISFLGFGGGYVIVPLLEAEISQNAWITQNEFADIVAVSQMTPGPIGINAATFIGIRTAGIFGGITASIGMILPSLILVIIVAHVMDRFKESRIMQSILQGIRPAVIGLIGFAVLFFASMSIFSGSMLDETFSLSFKGLGIFFLILILTVKFKIHPISAIALSAVLGIGLFYFL